jgi:WD40 repeat protein
VVALGDSVTETQPVDQEPTERMTNGVIIDSIGGDLSSPAKLAPLTDTGTAPYPVWAAFDQDSGRFLFPRGFEGLRVLEPGLDAPVSAIDCRRQCPAVSVVGPGASFGPAPDEVTVMVEVLGDHPRTAHVYGFDGSLRDSIDLLPVRDDSGIAEVEWSPDGSQLAVSTFTGSREPYCHGDLDCAARVWIIDPAASDPEMFLEQKMPPSAEPNPPLLTDLAWSPDGERLGLIKEQLLPAKGRGSSTTTPRHRRCLRRGQHAPRVR